MAPGGSSESYGQKKFFKFRISNPQMLAQLGVYIAMIMT